MRKSDHITKAMSTPFASRERLITIAELILLVSRGRIPMEITSTRIVNR
jgi:hypothetical protein